MINEFLKIPRFITKKIKKKKTPKKRMITHTQPLKAAALQSARTADLTQNPK